MTEEIPRSYEGRIVYINGEYYPAAEARISVFDHVVLYGDGVYDTCCAWNGGIFKLKAHIDRLFESAHAVKLRIPLSKKELENVAIEVVRRNGLQDAYLKIIITRGVGELPLMSPYNCKSSVIVFAIPFLSLVEGHAEKGIRVKTSSMRTTPSTSLPSKVKSCNYLNHILMRLEANEAGYDDAIELGIDGYVAEAPGYNVFLVKHQAIYTPEENILMGITRETVFELAKAEGIKVHIARLTPFDIYNADEVFFSSTAGGIFAVVEVDGRRISSGKPGPVTKKIKQSYFALLESGEASTTVYV